MPPPPHPSKCCHAPSEFLTCELIERRDSGIVTSRYMFGLFLNIRQHMLTCILGLVVILDYITLQRALRASDYSPLCNRLDVVLALGSTLIHQTRTMPQSCVFPLSHLTLPWDNIVSNMLQSCVDSCSSCRTYILPDISAWAYMQYFVFGLFSAQHLLGMVYQLLLL